MKKVLPATTSQPDLRHGNPMQGNIDLAIATPIEPEALPAARRDRDRRRAIVHCECAAGTKPTYISRLAK